MKNTFSMTFYCRKSAVRKSSKLAPIELVIIMNGDRWLFALPRKSAPEDFKREMRSKMQTPTKDYTSAVAAKIQGFQTKCLLEGRPFTKEGIKEFIHFGFTDDHYTMGFIFEGFLKTQKKKVDGGLSTYRNYRKYEIVRDLLYAHSDIHENTHLSAIRQKHIIDFNTQKKGAEVVTNSVTGDKSGKPASHKSRVYV